MDDLQMDYQVELEELKKEYADFLYIVSHDIKSPLRAISHLASWIEEDLDGNLNQDIINNFNLLKNRVGRLEKMMNALLELSRVNSTELELYEVNLPKMISDSIRIIEDSQNVEFHFNYNLNKENFETFGKKLQKVLFNLLDNAVRFHEKEKRNVYVEIFEKETDYEIKISDDGPGINDEIKDKIFNLFYTANSKDVLETVGAGLAISKKIVKMVGGKIEYFPAENKGSAFKVNWPKIINIKN